jgi:hypothetical protein
MTPQQQRQRRLTPMQKNALRRRGLGQTPAVNAVSPLPSCGTIDLASSVPQAVLMGGGGLAVLVGIIGAIVSDEYREDFAIAAGCGLVASFIGGIWAGASLQNLYNQCVVPQVNAALAPGANPPVPSPAPPVGAPDVSQTGQVYTGS